MDPIKVFLVEDERIVREGLRPWYAESVRIS